ncbi:bacteriophage abortive infection AbiH family protein [Ralstonia pseudosolanacearum]|uniref:bacteriophage abortive infection AbiH family protein n=1 Tax=Ralstonia pseudosolanacearum TaxID=1310165 RepID=UPI00405479E3
MNHQIFPTKLYVIGNGFDLWHRLPSSYGDFKRYVSHCDRQLLDAVDRYLPAGEEWNDLESAFADLDVESIIEDLGQFMGSYGDEDWSDAGHHDFQYEVDKVAEQLSTELRKRFGEWIRTLVIPTPATATARLKTIDTSSLFLNFNYTPTLREMYGVPNSQVLHIHGNAEQQTSALVLGHAWQPSQRRSLNDRPDIEDLDVRLVEAHDTLDEYFGKTFKPSGQLIRTHHAFFETLGSIQTVYVLGHSLSDVDLSYIQALLSIPAVAGAQWHIACRTESERPTKSARLVELGVDARRVFPMLWDHL